MKAFLIIITFSVIFAEIDSNVKVYKCEPEKIEPELKDDSEEVENLQVEFCDNPNDAKTCGQSCGLNCAIIKAKYTRLNFNFRPDMKGAIKSSNSGFLEFSWDILIGKEFKRGVTLRYLYDLTKEGKDLTNIMDMSNPNGFIINRVIPLQHKGNYKVHYNFFVPSLFFTGEYNMTIAINSKRGNLKTSMACGIVRGTIKD